MPKLLIRVSVLQQVTSNEYAQQRGSHLLSRSRCSSVDNTTDAVTSHAADTEMMSVETISGSVRNVHS